MLAIIIPMFNEKLRFPKDAFLDFVSTNSNIHFWLINDGSRDETSTLIHNLEALNTEKIFAIDLPFNRGKAEAVRIGINRALEKQYYNYVGYWDADLATPLNEILRFKESIASKPEIHFVLGARFQHLGANIKRKPLRHYLGRVFATIVSLMLGMRVYDTQCGAKIIESSLASRIFVNKFVSNWFFDVELIFRSKTLISIEQFKEIPLLNWADVSGSKLKLLDFLLTPWELFKIYRSYKR